MRYIITLFIILSSYGCRNSLPMVKPFIIVGKFISYEGEGIALYYYEDQVGKSEKFTELNGKYNIGDTIK